ncbi:hypothetical protein HDV06_003874 [Boothiomyces sp. JEL0866]|nr:hypothetical protein HDV06_003874 [Boothiomyces sp. JEL0866]
MKINFAALLAVLQYVSAVPTKGQYEGDKVFQFQIENKDQQQLVQSVVREHRLDAWTDIVVGPTDIRVKAKDVKKITELLKDVKSTVKIDNLQVNIDAERAHTANHLQTFANAKALTAAQVFSDYQDASTYVKFLQGLKGTTPISLGKTYEGNDILGVKFGTGAKQIVVHGGIHAREWISPSTTTYIANALITGTDSATVALKNTFTFHFIPVLNVDGYKYTRDPNGDRMNRKNREPNSGSDCVGTDPNRNFDYAWSQPGASNDPCADDFYGPSAASSKEVQAITAYLKSLNNVVSYIDFHSYSQLFMYPWGYSCDASNPDANDQGNAAQAAVSALQNVNGLSFTPGDICNTIYQASGSSTDYAYGTLGIKYSYGVELRPTSDDGNGFVLPASNINPAGKETLAAVIAAWQYVAKN